MTKTDIAPILAKLRIDILKSAQLAGHAHIPSAFSILEIMYALRFCVMEAEDRFILSKGHGVLALYAINGFLEEYAQRLLPGHPEQSRYIEATTGSLGHGLGIAAGLAMAKKMRGDSGIVYCLLGDEECQEGSVYEAARIIQEQQLPVVAIIDNNQITNLAQWQWKNQIHTNSARDGHDILAIIKGFEFLHTLGVPGRIRFSTVKGFGVKEMENDPGAWHHRTPTEEEVNRFSNEISLRASIK